MTNKHSQFIPHFSSDKPLEERNTSRMFIQKYGKSATCSQDDVELKNILDEGEGLLGNKSHQPTFETTDMHDIAVQESLIDAEDEFDKILSRVTEDAGQMPSHQNQSSSIGSLMDIENLLSDDDHEPEDISDEQREVIYAEGYMAGSLEQKAALEQHTEELRKTVDAIKGIENLPDNLSFQINDSIAAFAKSLVNAVIGEAKSNLLEQIVSSKTEEFIKQVKGWDATVYVHCSVNDFKNISEILGQSPLPSGIKMDNYTYIEDAEQMAGNFRLEICREGDAPIEAVMDIDAHFQSIKESASELL